MTYNAVPLHDQIFTSGRNKDKNDNPRGLRVWNLAELERVQGQTLSGRRQQVQIQRPYFILDPYEREEIFRLCSDVLGIVTSRMNRISSMEWKVVSKFDRQEETADEMKSMYQVYNEWDGKDLQAIMIRYRIKQQLQKEMPDLKPDLSNFQSALYRWSKKYKKTENHIVQEICDWIYRPNREDYYADLTKMWIKDLMVHGTGTEYLLNEVDPLKGVFILPGGSVLPIRQETVGGITGYVQMTQIETPRIYFGNEMIFSRYIPSSSRSYGDIPLEALINRIAEKLLFDKLAADRADGTKPPEKLVILGDKNSMFGDFGDVNFDMPLPKEEQKKIKKEITMARKEAVAVLSGIGTPVVVDISKADTFSEQSKRAEMVRKEVAVVYNMSNMEINLTGSDGTSGRETGESQERIEKSKGIAPIIQMRERIISDKWIPYRFGTSAWIFEYNDGISDNEQIAQDTAKQNSGTYSVNEIRRNRGDAPYPEDKYNRPMIGAEQEQQMQQPEELNV